MQIYNQNNVTKTANAKHSVIQGTYSNYMIFENEKGEKMILTSCICLKNI